MGLRWCLYCRLRMDSLILKVTQDMKKVMNNATLFIRRLDDLGCSDSIRNDLVSLSQSISALKSTYESRDDKTRIKSLENELNIRNNELDETYEELQDSCMKVDDLIEYEEECFKLRKEVESLKKQLAEHTKQ